jgi:hypothetical protein
MYFGEHSIRFYPDENYVGNFPFDSEANPEDCPDTWERWHLVPTGKVIFQPPEYKQNLLEIPGRNGPVDVNKYTFGRPVYGARTGDIEFILDPDYIDDWPDIYSDMMRYFQGQERCAVLRDDRYFYYKGFFSVSELTPDESWDTVKLNYTLEPFKCERWTRGSVPTSWMLAGFDFEPGVIWGPEDINVETSSDGIQALDILSPDLSGVPCFKRAAGSSYPAVVDAFDTLLSNIPTVSDDATAQEVLEQITSEKITSLRNELSAAKVSYYNAGYPDNTPLNKAVSDLDLKFRQVAWHLAQETPNTYAIKHIISEAYDYAQTDVRMAAIEGLVRASLDGEQWYNVCSVYEKPGNPGTKMPELALAGKENFWRTPTLYLRGKGDITIQLRGGTL